MRNNSLNTHKTTAAIPPANMRGLASKLARPFYWWFWWCAGAMPRVMEEMSTDREKYLSMGIAIFLTGIVATLTMSYAMDFVFQATTAAAVIGLIWGLVVFNLDRTLTMAMGKSGNSLDQLLFSDKVAAALPHLALFTLRVLLAIIVGHAIVVPLELRLFHDSVEREFIVKQEEQEKRQHSEWEAFISAETSKIDALIEADRKRIKQAKTTAASDMQRHKQEIMRHGREIAEARTQQQQASNLIEQALNAVHARRVEDTAELNRLYQVYIEEVKNGGEGPIALKKLNEYTDFKKHYEQREARRAQQEQQLIEQQEGLRSSMRDSIDLSEDAIKRNETAIADIDSALITEIARFNQIRAEREAEKDKIRAQQKVPKADAMPALNQHDFLLRLEVLYSLIERNAMTQGTHLVFLMIVILIEILPVFIKLIYPRSAYDAEVDRIARLAIQRADTAHLQCRACGATVTV